MLPWLLYWPWCLLLFANQVSAWIWVIISIVYCSSSNRWPILVWLKTLITIHLLPTIFCLPILVWVLAASLFFSERDRDFALEKANSKLTEQSKWFLKRKMHLTQYHITEDIADFQLKSRAIVKRDSMVRFPSFYQFPPKISELSSHCWTSSIFSFWWYHGKVWNGKD